MIPPNLLSSTVTIKRRNSQGRDALNNPTYGQPTSGAGWSTVQTGIQVFFAFSSKGLRFALEGERVQPNGIMYYNNVINLKEEDRVMTSDGIEYTVTGLAVAYLMGNVISHYEAVVQLP
jgi:hypothetical protein